MTLADAVTRCLWVAAHHGLRARSIARDPHDIAPYPRAAWRARLWSYVHDITKDLGHPAAPGEGKVRR